MKYIKSLSIKNFLFGVVGLLVIILTVQSVSNLWNNYTRHQEIARVDMANEMSDFIIEASGYEAIERGVTATALAATTASESRALKGKIDALRDKGAKALEEAKVRVTVLTEEIDTSNTVLATAFANYNERYASLERTRKAVDSELGRDAKNLKPSEWIKEMTSFIEAGRDLRLASLTTDASKETLQEALRMNLELKQAVWLVSEYAGRERATLGSYIGSGRPLDPAVRERLNTYRAIVELNIKPIQNLKGSQGIAPAIISSINDMENTFLGRFSTTRDGVYAAADTGQYPLDGAEWLKKSTEAINTILGVTTAVGIAVDDKVMAELAASERSMIFSAASLAFIVGLGLFSLWVIKRKVVSPMHYINESMGHVEESGDLTFTLDVTSEDENGQMATAFNKMIDKFHNIIQEIHTSTERLASSSEELSASSVLIADGSKEQSTRATQVSTAAQQMSATLLEVVKNIAGASEAASDASTVAMRGGEIVSQSIESMHGISNTARESSQIISTLGGRSEQIGNIINVIDDIADQTNLLALNAAIEAARAGEQGRGFAVVADEVRKLAEKTMGATKEIGGMIQAMQDETRKAITSVENEVKAVEDGVQLAQEAGEALRAIVEKVDVVTSMVHQISTASEEQSAATEQITGDIDSVAGVITETSASAEQIAKASQEIAELSVGLKTTVEIFKVSKTSGARRDPGAGRPEPKPLSVLVGKKAV